MFHVNKKDRCSQGRKKQSEIKELLISGINCYFNHNPKNSNAKFSRFFYVELVHFLKIINQNFFKTCMFKVFCFIFSFVPDLFCRTDVFWIQTKMQKMF